jgi:hypothetical protein
MEKIIDLVNGGAYTVVKQTDKRIYYTRNGKSKYFSKVDEGKKFQFMIKNVYVFSSLGNDWNKFGMF